MPANRKVRRLVTERMARTGEPYARALRAVLAEADNIDYTDPDHISADHRSQEEK